MSKGGRDEGGLCALGLVVGSVHNQHRKNRTKHGPIPLVGWRGMDPRRTRRRAAAKVRAVHD